MPNQNIGIRVNVKVAKREFIPDPKGPIVGLDGQRGSYGPWNAQMVHNLLTDDGRDFLHVQGYETTGLTTNGGNYIALTTNSDAPADADSDLTGEIVADGLERAQATVSHTPGDNTSTLVNTFTATDAHTGVQKSGIFSAAAAGTLVHEATFASVNLQNNDQLQVTWTITLDD